MSLQADWRRRGEENAQAETTAGETAAANYQSQARARAIESMGAPHGVSRLDEATLQEQACQRGDLAKRNAAMAGEIDKEIAERHAAATAECAHDLEKQLTEQNEKSTGVLLNPVGTNLYVRNYQFHTTPPVVPLRTNVQAILSPLAKTQAKVAVPSSKTFNQSSLRGEAAGLRVHGELMHTKRKEP